MTLRFLFLLCFLSSGLYAQDPHIFLPRNLTAQEIKAQALGVPDNPPGSDLVDPPASPVRAMAEWEELQALCIAWNGQSTILAEIVRAARLECNVLICCENQSIITSAKNTLTSKGVDITSNVTFLVAPNNSIWMRDYGPNCVYANGVDSLYLVDWIYNRPRPKDDAIPLLVGAYLNVPVYSTTAAPYDLVNTGGNFMSDGLGTAFASRLIYTENGPNNNYGQSNHSEAEVKNILQEFMGINRYINMTTLPFDEIHHIDMHMKLLDEETLLVGQYPAGIADGPQIEANLQYVLNTYKSAFGTPYKVIRIPMPADGGGAYPDNGGQYRTYANAVFVNKTVLLPFYQEKYDTTAQRIWEQSLPGYKIVGINCNNIIGSLGAIHCITKEIGVAAPLHIVHQSLPCMNNTEWSAGYPVWANIDHRSGIASAKIFYANNPAGPWNSIPLPAYILNDTSWNFQGFIPTQPEGSTVYYYLEATANDGKTTVHPLTAPQGWWKFCVTNSVSNVELPTAELRDIYPNPAAAITC
ncbi:MAG: agmatine deiminase family protein, partial [Saprospiraceae bacterium]